MRKLHLAVGMFIVAAFLLTGQFMRFHAPPMSTLSDSTRLLFRSRHIYILSSGLINLMLGLYLHPLPEGWRRVVQTAGSALLLGAPVPLLAAFVVEPHTRFLEHTLYSSAGLYALFGGAMAHLAARIAERS